MAETILEYLHEPYRYFGTATLQEIRTDDKGRSALVLDRTIFYPQGGGQACDLGRIEDDSFRFDVAAVTCVDGVVLHSGVGYSVMPAVGEPVTLRLNEQRRIFNSRLQSGGHLLLNAMRDAGQALVATKGYHFPDSPYLEFAGTVPESDRAALVEILQGHIDRLIGSDLPVIQQFLPYERLGEICRNVPPGVPRDRPIRVITIDGFSQPCGGTHVRSLSELTGMRIVRLKVKRRYLRVSYVIPDGNPSAST